MESNGGFLSLDTREAEDQQWAGGTAYQEGLSVEQLTNTHKHTHSRWQGAAGYQSLETRTQQGIQRLVFWRSGWIRRLTGEVMGSRCWPLLSLIPSPNRTNFRFSFLYYIIYIITYIYYLYHHWHFLQAILFFLQNNTRKMFEITALCSLWWIEIACTND